MKNYHELDPIKYYDDISLKYDYTLNSSPNNTKTRNEVKNYFLKNVNGKFVLDFGGGTGKDLKWLLENGFQVYFCEPSMGMRKLAAKNFQNTSSSSQITFLDDHSSNFQKWNKNNIPIENKIDGILANFAVFNSIKQLEELSEKLALISHNGTRLITTVLHLKLKKILLHDFPSILNLYLRGNGLATKVQDGNHQMVVYLHTKSKLIKSFKKYFDYVESFPISGSSFKLLHFRRNDYEVS